MESLASAPGLTTVTSTTLLDGLRHAGNRTAWQDFTGRYYPLLWRFARRMGLGPEDAEDAAQESLAAFARAFQDGKYDRDKGRLRAWLFGIARHHVQDCRRRQLAHRRRPVEQPDDSSLIEQVPDGHDEDQVWEEEWRQSVLHQCMVEVRATLEARTVDAFELFARQGLPAREVATRLGMTENAVFLAKHKVLKRIRQLVPVMEEAW